jgi:hypothetical protein
VPKPDDSQAIVTLEPDRRRLICERLRDDFYAGAVPSERIATAVLTALYALDKGPSQSH